MSKNTIHQNSLPKIKHICPECKEPLDECQCEYGLHEYGEAIFWDCPCPRCSKHFDEEMKRQGF